MASENYKKKAGSSEHLCISSSTNNIIEENSVAGSTIEEKGDDFTDDALKNYLILNNILNNLDNDDLGTCCQVNKWWNSIAKPLYVTYYDIELAEPSIITAELTGTSWEQQQIYCATITKRATYDSETVKYLKRTLADASELLEEAVKTDKIAVSFRFSWYDERSNAVRSFLSKLGEHIETFCVGGHMPRTAFCEALRFMPNLTHLGCSHLKLSDHDFDPNDHSIRMQFLRTIDGGRAPPGHHSLVYMLKIAPNLEDIHSFPVLSADALVPAEKAMCVRSVTYPTYGEDAFTTEMQTLGNLNLRLTNFSFLNLRAADCQPFVRRILESSRDSLERLTLWRTGSFDFQVLPPMNSLKEIEFSLELENENVTKMFAPNTDLQRVFPNVSVVNIPNSRSYSTLYSSDPPLLKISSVGIAHANSYFYEDQFASWGSHIKDLKLLDVSGDILRQMSVLFPSVKHLDFRVIDCNELQVKLREIGEYWLDVGCLTIRVGRHSIVDYPEFPAPSECTLDSVFTGIPDVTIAQLRDPGLRNQNFTSEEIENLMEGLLLRKLSNLKMLRFPLQGNDWDDGFLGKLSAITSISKEFGFQFLPDLKIVVRTPHHQFEEVADTLKASLQTLVHYEVENTG